ncbi:spidroin-1-like [Iris pallida]|uniref:Spidroin-1-like n=1 Tax=Iris pallida TaxID=29817 RepID=A0AAX6DU77_IRIPA|nr:spidroin-1-like [Iris pallida]
MDPAKCKRNRLRPDVEALAQLRIGPYLRLYIYPYFYYLILFIFYPYLKFRTNNSFVLFQFM